MYLSESQVNDYEENCLVNSNLSKHPTQAQSLKQFKTLGDKSSSINKKLFSISLKLRQSGSYQVRNFSSVQSGDQEVWPATGRLNSATLASIKEISSVRSQRGPSPRAGRP